MALADVINLTISRSAPPVSVQGFGQALIMGPNFPAGLSPAIQKVYSGSSGLAAMITDGFTTSNPEYKAAAALLSQQNQPTKFQVGKRTTTIVQVITFTPTVQNTTLYSVTINGTAFTFTSSGSATAANIVTGLLAAIATPALVTASGTTTLILTSSQAGVGFTYTSSANLVAAVTTANNGPVEDLTAVFAADNSSYAVIMCTRDANEIPAVAGYIETQRKVYIACTADAAVIGSGTTDVASVLKAKSYARTAVIYSGDNADFPEAAWFGTFLPLQPGSYNTKFQTLAGVTYDQPSASSYANAKGKNANLYDLVGGLGMTEDGVMASGDFIDVIIGIDWLYANLQADIYQQFKNAASLGKKIPYTDVGFTAIQATIQARLRLAEKASILADSSSVVTLTPVAQQAPSDVAARRMAGITFSAKLAGAVNQLTITGSVVN